MSTTSDILDHHDDFSSLADPCDFNRDPSDFPALGLKKRYFPDVYPQYASTPSKRSRTDSSDEDEGFNYPSSPQVQEKKDLDCEW
jgi:hypothetical protein